MTLVHTSHNALYGKTSWDAYHFYIYTTWMVESFFCEIEWVLLAIVQ